MIFANFRFGVVAEPGIGYAQFRQSAADCDFRKDNRLQFPQKLRRVRRILQQSGPQQVKLQNVRAGTEE